MNVILSAHKEFIFRCQHTNIKEEIKCTFLCVFMQVDVHIDGLGCACRGQRITYHYSDISRFY